MVVMKRQVLAGGEQVANNSRRQHIKQAGSAIRHCQSPALKGKHTPSQALYTAHLYSPPPKTARTRPSALCLLFRIHFPSSSCPSVLCVYPPPSRQTSRSI